MLVPEERRRKARKFVKEKNLTSTGGLSAVDRTWLRDIYHDDVKRLSVSLGQDLFVKWRW
jgi:hypothetical protein